jgi:hemolysin activation/secretion protein
MRHVATISQREAEESSHNNHLSRFRVGLAYARTGLLIVAGLSAASVAAAQSASQITPHSFAPPIQGTADVAGMSIGELPGLDTPEGADQLFVTLSSVVVTYESPALSQVGARVRAKLVGKRISGADIFAAARELEAAYAKAGYVLVRVILPPQDLRDGATLTLNIVDGYIERVEMANVSSRVQSRIMRLVGPLVGKHELTLKEIERRVLLAGDVPGVILRSTLAPGSQTGAAVLVLEARYQSFDLSLSGDNTLSSALGGRQFGAAADWNGVGGLGELTYARVGGDPSAGADSFMSDRPRNRSLAAGLIVPTGDQGVSVNLEGTRTHTTPLEQAGTQSSDLFERLSLRARYPWIRSRNFNLNSQLVLDAENETENLILPAQLPLFEDRLRVLREMQEWNHLNRFGGSFSGSMTVSWGFDAFGARSAAAATSSLPLSRQGAQANFKKLEATLDYSQSLAAHLSASISARGQVAFGHALVRSEEFGIADPDALSTFDAGSLEGDGGYVLRAELSSPWGVPLKSGRAGLLISPYLFGADGRVVQADPTRLEVRDSSGTSVGAGLRLGGAAAASSSNASLNLELGREGGAAHDATRFRLSASFKF